MKDIKSLIIGFLLATCMFLFMGFMGNIVTPGPIPYSYHPFAHNNNKYIVNTLTGEMWKFVDMEKTSENHWLRVANINKVKKQ